MMLMSVLVFMRERRRKMAFSKYSSIENTNRDKTILQIQTQGYDRGLWSVTERTINND